MSSGKGSDEKHAIQAVERTDSSSSVARPWPGYAADKFRTHAGDGEEDDPYRLEKTDTGKTGSEYHLERSATRDANRVSSEDEENTRVDFKTFMACLSLSFLWTGSQIPLYLLLATVNSTIEDIGGANVQVWFVLGPLSALAAIAPAAGSISDILGRRYAILAGGASMVVGLVLIGAAQNPAMELVSMPFTGAGAALLEVNALAAVNEIAPNRLRGFYTSVLTGSIIPFFPSGIYAVQLSTYASWRWCVWVPLIWVCIGQALTFFFYHPPPRRLVAKYTRVEVLKRMDWIGYFLSTTGLVLFLFGLGSGGNTSPWKSATTIVPIILGALLIGALAIWERHARRPLFPTVLFKSIRVFVLPMVITAVAGSLFFSGLILYPKFVFAVYIPSPLRAGAMITGQQISIFVGAAIFSASVSRFKGSIRPQMMLATAMMAAGLGGIVACKWDDSTTPNILVVIAGLGIGGIILPAAVVAQLCTPDEYIGSVTAIAFVARVVGGAIGFTVSYYVLNQEMTRLYEDLSNPISLQIITLCLRNGLSVDGIETFLKAVAIDDIATARGISGVNENLITYVKYLSRPLWKKAFDKVWLTTLAFSLLGFVAALGLGDVRKYMTNHRAVHL